MKKSIIIFSILLLLKGLIFDNEVSAQPEIEWRKNFGGSDVEVGYLAQQTVDNGYIIVGYSGSSDGGQGGNIGEDDYWILKLDMAGNIEWEKKYGGSGIDRAVSIQQTIEGGYVVAGGSESIDGDVGANNGDTDFWILKLNMLGDIEWEKNYGGVESDFARSIQQTTDGGYIVAGRSVSNTGNGDYLILKLDMLGDIEWEKTYGGSGSELPTSIQQTMDGGFIVSGKSESNDGDVGGNNGEGDYWILKLDMLGNMEWEQNFGGSNEDVAQSIQQTTDGGYIVAGRSESNDGDVGGNKGAWDYWILKLDVGGNIEWEKNYGGTRSDWANSIMQIADGSYIVAGQSESNDKDVGGNKGKYDYWILNLDLIGNIKWEKNYGGTDQDFAHSIQQTGDEGYIVAGYSWSDDEDVENNNGASDYWLVKLTSLFVGVENTNFSPEITIFPNPSNYEFTIRTNELINSFNVEIFDLFGQSIYKRKEIQKEIKINDIAKGNYYIHITTDEISLTKKLVLH